MLLPRKAGEFCSFPDAGRAALGEPGCGRWRSECGAAAALPLAAGEQTRTHARGHLLLTLEGFSAVWSLGCARASGEPAVHQQKAIDGPGPVV